LFCFSSIFLKTKMSYQITELDYVDEDDFREVLKKWEKKALVTGCKIERRISRGVHFWMVPSFEPVKEEVSTVADLEDSDVDPDWQIDFSAEDLDIESDLSCDSVCEDILCELDNEDNIIVESYCDQEDDFVFPSDDESYLITDIENPYPSIDIFFFVSKRIMVVILVLLWFLLIILIKVSALIMIVLLVLGKVSLLFVNLKLMFHLLFF